MKYAVVIEKTPNNYAAYVPDLPGCVSTGRIKGRSNSTNRGSNSLPS